MTGPEASRPLLDRVLPAAGPEGEGSDGGAGGDRGADGDGPGRAAVRGERWFPADEPFFAGHFPGLPVVPGVFLLESLAECARRALAEEAPGRRFTLTGVTGVRFRRRVEPGDRAQFEARPLTDGSVEAEGTGDPQTGADSGRRRFRAEASVNGQRAVEATLEFR